MTFPPTSSSTSAPARILLFGLWRVERECLERALSADSGLRLQNVASVAEALSGLEAGDADALVCDLGFYLFLRESEEAAGFDPAGVPTLALVSPGEECRVGERLALDPTDFLLRAGDYCALLPAGVRRLARRRQARWEEVAALLRHEINNPLTGVLGNAELILAEASALPAKTRHRLTTIIELAVRLRDVVRNLETQLDRGGNGSRRNCPPAGPLRLPRSVAP